MPLSGRFAHGSLQIRVNLDAPSEREWKRGRGGGEPAVQAVQENNARKPEAAAPPCLLEVRGERAGQGAGGSAREPSGDPICIMISFRASQHGEP